MKTVCPTFGGAAGGTTTIASSGADATSLIEIDSEGGGGTGVETALLGKMGCVPLTGGAAILILSYVIRMEKAPSAVNVAEMSSSLACGRLVASCWRGKISVLLPAPESWKCDTAKIMGAVHPGVLSVSMTTALSPL